MLRCTTLIKTVAVALLVLPLTGCWELISWSPDGKYLAFLSGEEQSLWVWDRETQQAKRIHDSEVYACRFTPSGYLIYAAEPISHGFFSGGVPEHESDTLELHVRDLANDEYFYQYHVCLESWAASADGKFLVYETKKKDEPYELWKQDLNASHNRTKIMELPEAILLPALDDTGLRLAYVVEGAGNSLNVTNLGDNTTTVLAQTDKEFLYPTWLNDHEIVYLESTGDEEDEVGHIKIVDVDSKEMRQVSDLGVSGARIHLDQTKENVVVTAQRPDRPERWDSSSQVARVNLASGAVTWLTDDPFGALWADYNAATNSVAYISAHDGDNLEDAMVQVTTLDDNRNTTVWYDDEGRLYAAADALRESGRSHEAVAMYEDLLLRFPEGRLRSRANYRLMEIYLTPAFNDFDKAYKAYALSGFSEQAHSLLWANPPATAEDPAHDWIRTYGTDASKQEFRYDTDGPRDLIGLAAKWSPTRLYLRIAYNSTEDLSGLVFSDTLVLFDANSPAEGLKQITPVTAWDRGAERTIVFRHWFQSDKSGEYDVAILNDKGEPRAWISGSRFGTLSDAPVEVMETQSDYDNGTGSLVLSIDPALFGWKAGDTLQVQVVTTKGGIESHRGLERPREVVSEETAAPLCDIADAFGAENTREAIDQQITDGKPGESTGIRGYAIELEVPKLREAR